MTTTEIRSSEGPREDFEETEGMPQLLPLRFLGMGLLIAWMCCAHIVWVFPGPDFPMGLRNAFDTGMRIGDIVALLALAAAAPRLGSLGAKRRLNEVAVALSVVGTWGIGLGLIPGGASEAVVLLCSIPTAFGGACLFCLWAQVYARMGITRAVVYGSLSCLLAAGVSFVVTTMKAPYAIVATGLLPLVSLLCVLQSLRLVPNEPLRSRDVRYPMPWKLIVVMMVAGFLSGASGTGLPQPEGVGSVMRVAATGLAGAVLLGLMSGARDRMDVRILAKTAAVLALLAIALIPFSGTAVGFAEAFLLKLSYVWFTLFVLLVLANIAFRFDVPSLRMFALARALSETGIFVGIFLRRAFRDWGLFDNQAFLIAFAACGLVLVVACILVWLSEKTVTGDWGAAGVSLEGGAHLPTPRERFMNRCDELARDHGLTEREREIMALIAEGKTRKQIEQDLFLSENTVKTHVRHVHAKLGTKSKNDVMALFEGAQPPAL